MKVAILASNIRAGGGLTHLVELVRAWDRHRFGVDELLVIAPPALRQQLPNSKASFIDTASGGGAIDSVSRWIRLASNPRCDVLFVPGGIYFGRAANYTTLSQNLLPFQPEERARYRGPRLGRLWLLRILQGASMRSASGALFLTNYARQVVTDAIGAVTATAVVPHGVDGRFFMQPRPQRPFTFADPMRLLYVSTISPYKHQWHVVEAVAHARRTGTPIILELIGRAEAPEFRRLQRAVEQCNAASFVNYVGDVPYSSIHKRYHAADAFVFASSCENLPNILLEAMAAGLPIASSNRQPMPEVLGDAGLYFDPLSPEEISSALTTLAGSPSYRADLARKGFHRAEDYSWLRCGLETFQFLKERSVMAKE